MATIVLGGGCFWCLEAVFQRLKGVNAVLPGYSGGKAEEANYKMVCSGSTEHAEVVKLDYDETIIELKEILNVFFAVHDPTTLNRQGNDQGPQYRSVIFFSSDGERQVAQSVIDYLTLEFEQPIVTELTPLEAFYSAEKYHENYYNNNSSQSYCQIVVASKIERFKQYMSGKT